MKALGGVLKVNDVKMLAVALEGLENILKCGQLNFLDENGENKFAIQMEMDGSIDDLEELQQHPNHNIYNQALKIIDTYFNEDAQNDPLLNAIL